MALLYRSKNYRSRKKPDSVIIIYQGKGRLLGYDPRTSIPITLELLEPGAILGEISLLREVACETAIASTEVICLTINARNTCVYSHNTRLLLKPASIAAISWKFLIS